MAIMERHNLFKDMIRLYLKTPDRSNPRRHERRQTITVIQLLRRDVISVDKVVANNRLAGDNPTKGGPPIINLTRMTGE